MSARTATLVAALAGGLALGCGVDRRLRIETEPPGAEVIVDGRVLGESPLVLHFTHYGPRLVRAELREDPNGKTFAAQRIVELEPPWYGSFPFDFFSEILFPVWRTDNHEVVLHLEPGSSLPAVPPEDAAARDDDALKRARELRRWTPGDPVPVVPASKPASSPRP